MYWLITKMLPIEELILIGLLFVIAHVTGVIDVMGLVVDPAVSLLVNELGLGALV